MRNAVKRITHKERAQPKARARFGLLEKHKDYVERAADFKKKRAAIKTLKKKAAERNPDEFYFAMHNSEVKNGVHTGKSKNRTIDTPIVRLLKTQDMGYIVHKRSVDDRKAEKLSQNLHFIGEAVPKKHKIFVDDADKLKSFDVAKHFDTAPELVGRVFNRPRSEEIDKVIINGGGAQLTSTADSMKRILKKQSKAYKELQSRTKRSEKLTKVMNGLALQRNLMGKGARTKIVVKGSADKDTDDDHTSDRKRNRDDDESGDSSSSKSKVVYKWKRERRR